MELPELSIEGTPLDVKNTVFNIHHTFVFHLFKELNKDLANANCLQQLVDHLVSHFRAEESMFEEREWDPHASAMHTNSHANLVAILGTLSAPLSPEVFELLVRLVALHVLGEDVPYAGALADSPRAHKPPRPNPKKTVQPTLADISASSGRKRISVCGAGVVGMCIAYYLVQNYDDKVEVTIYDPAGPGGNPSGLACNPGLLASDWDVFAPSTVLSQKGFELHTELAFDPRTAHCYRQITAHQIDFHLEPNGGNAVSPGESSPKSPKSKARKPPAWISSNNTFVRRSRSLAQCDPAAFVAFLTESITQKGVKFVKSQVDKIEHQNSRVTGVLTTDGITHDADVVVIATGPWACELINHSFPDVMTMLSPSRFPFRISPMFIAKAVQTVKIGLGEPISGNDVVMVHYSAKGATYDTCPEIVPSVEGDSVTVVGLWDHLAALPTPSTWATSTSSTHTQEIACSTTLTKLCQSISPHIAQHKRSVESSVGFVPLSLDALPVIGALPGPISGAYIATGHGFWGLLQAPSTAVGIAQLIMEGRSDIDLTAFDPARFTSSHWTKGEEDAV